MASVLAMSLPGELGEVARYLSPGALMMNGLILLAQQTRASRDARLGALLDFVNAKLAGVRTEAVLVSRIRENVDLIKKFP